MIKDRWYAVLEAAGVPTGRPAALRRFGLDLVAWRGKDGAAVLQQDRCPHRGARLSPGRVVDGALACPYHGFRFDRAGACVKIPVEGPEARIPRGMCARTFPTREAHGLLWAWYGEPREVYPEVPWFDELPSDLSNTASGSLVYPVHYSRVVESNFDVYHFPFVHRSLNPGALGERVVDYEVEVEGEHIRTRGRLVKSDGDPGVPFRVELLPPNLQLLQLTEKVRGAIVSTPIDDDHTWVWARFYQDYLRLPVLGRLFTEALVWFEWTVVQSRQDIPVLSGITPPRADPGASRFVAADGGSARYVQLRARLLRAQEEAADPDEEGDEEGDEAGAADEADWPAPALVAWWLLP